MTVKRMTKQSSENLKVADSVRIVALDDGSGFMVMAFRGERSAVLQCSDGPMVYPSVLVARRSVRRIRPNLEPTEI